jgi:hypothetical protein
MSNTAATPSAMVPVSEEAIRAALREIGMMPTPTNWTLIAPDGRAYIGDIQQIMGVIMQHHPLFKPTLGLVP